MHRLGPCVLVALAACQSGFETRKVFTLGHGQAPAVMIATRLVGADLEATQAAEAWATKLEADPSISVVGKVSSKTGEHRSLCDEARAFRDPPVDEILLIEAYGNTTADETCLDYSCPKTSPLEGRVNTTERCSCLRTQYRKSATAFGGSMKTIRRSTCEVVATFRLPSARAESPPHPPLDSRADRDRMQTVRDSDATESRRAGTIALSRVVAEHTWQLYPALENTVRSTGEGFVVRDPEHRLELGRTYAVKSTAPADPLTADVIKVDGNTATLASAGGPIEARDEIHDVVDVRHVMTYASVSGGTARVDNGNHGLAGASLASRLGFEKLPLMFELRLGGDLVPGVESARWDIAGAAGARYKIGPLVPFAFGELGVGAAYQDGARALGIVAGLGAGVELLLGRWAVFGDIRRRYLSLGDWERDGMAVDVMHPDPDWSSTTIQLGVGTGF